MTSATGTHRRPATAILTVLVLALAGPGPAAVAQEAGEPEVVVPGPLFDSDSLLTMRIAVDLPKGPGQRLDL